MYKIISSEHSTDIAQMEQFIRSHPNCHFLQTPQWREVKTFWNWRGVLSYNAEGELIGALSLLIRPLPLGMSLLYAPRGPICDRADPSVFGELLAGAKEVARAFHALLLHMDPDELDSNRDFRRMMQDFGFREQSDDGFGNIQPQFVFRMGIADRSEAELFARFTQKTRYNIRLAQRKGVVIEEYPGDRMIPDSVIHSFDRLMAVTGERDHFTVRGGEYFRQLLAAFGANASLFLARYQGQPIAGTVAVFYGNKAWYLYGASANEHRNTMPNYLLQWEMLRSALQRGCSIYDFRGVSGDLSEDNPLYGLYRFKKGFNGTFTKFTGLFTYHYRPLLSRLFLRALDIYRKLSGLKK